MARIINRDSTLISVDAIGNVEFYSPSEWHLGNRAWNCAFKFSVPVPAGKGDFGGAIREYWGTVFRSGDVELMTRDERTGHGRRLAETHKVEWRKALLEAGRAYLRPYQQSRLAEIEAQAATDVAHLQTAPVRRDNVEYHAGKNAFHAGEQQIANPYLSTAETRANPDSRWNRWDCGFREACDAFLTAKPAVCPAGIVIEPAGSGWLVFDAIGDVFTPTGRENQTTFMQLENARNEATERAKRFVSIFGAGCCDIYEMPATERAKAIQAGRDMARHMIDYRDEMRVGGPFQRQQGETLTAAFWLERCRIERACMAANPAGWHSLYESGLSNARHALADLRRLRLATSAARDIAGTLNRDALRQIIQWCEFGAENSFIRAAEMAKSGIPLSSVRMAQRDADTFRNAAHYLSMLARNAK